MSWAWPEIRRGNVKIVEFSDDVEPGKPWAGSIEDIAPVVPKRRRSGRRRAIPTRSRFRCNNEFHARLCVSSRCNVSRVETSARLSTLGAKMALERRISTLRVLSS